MGHNPVTSDLENQAFETENVFRKLDGPNKAYAKIILRPVNTVKDPSQTVKSPKI